MFTKKDYAEYLIKNHLNETRVNISIRDEIDYESLVNEVYGSTSLGLALQYLGYIKDPVMNAYLNERGGTEKIVTIFVNGKADTKILTVREMFDLLPEKEEEE